MTIQLPFVKNHLPFILHVWKRCICFTNRSVALDQILLNWGFCNSGYVLTLKLTSMFSNSNCPQSLSRGKIYGNGPADVAWAPNPYAGIFSSCLKLVNTFPIVFRVLTYSFYKRNLRPYFKGGRETNLQSSCEKRAKRRLRHVDDSDWYNDDVM